MLRDGSFLALTILGIPNGNPGKIYISFCEFGGEGNIDCIKKKKKVYMHISIYNTTEINL